MVYTTLRYAVVVLCTALMCCTPALLWCQAFTTSNLVGESLNDPTSLAFGPDGRLYILELNGTIEIYTVVRNGANDYDVTATEVITSVKNIENHNDDGTVHGTMERLATGLTVSGTPANPVIYVTSSDYRQGGLLGGGDVNLDTNSGTITRLTWNGSSWNHVDIVRGLPRSEENHATNGLLLDTAANTLYVASGGLTNAGSPSFAFAFLCEYALSCCILSVDLTAIEAMPVQTDTSSGASYIYDLPTVDDPTRGNANGIDDPIAMGYDGVDLHDPFGGNDGLNQARLVVGGPVQVYASGFRNAYDLVKTQAGRMYIWDNGANQGWGGHPADEGVGTATNAYAPGEPGSNGPGPNDPQVNNLDGLHMFTAPGYYAGHPNPIRGNPDSAGLFTHPTGFDWMDGLYRTGYTSNPDSSLPFDWPPVPPALANPVEGDFQLPGPGNGALYTHELSTNGIAEYTATNFDSAMLGDLVAVGFNSTNEPLFRVNLNASGTIDHPDSVTIIGSGFGTFPLDVVTQGDFDPFPGTIWAITHGSANVTIFEPADFFECTGADDNMIDEDNDGYTNADEIDNGTNPCNGADMPPDHDGTLIAGFKVSDLNDPDDDDDGLNDTLDFFVWDPDNGTTTTLPVNLPLLNSDPGTGFYGLGFTGLMASQTDDYLDLWQTEDNSTVEIIAGGASGLLTFVNIDQGDALGGFNDQHNAFQFGFAVDSNTAPFAVIVDVVGPVFPDTIQDFQSMGMVAGTGNQEDYVKLVINANSGTPNILLVQESAGTVTSTPFSAPGIGSATLVQLVLVINPAIGYVKAKYNVNGGTDVLLGDGFFLDGPFLTALKGSDAIAAGVISTARGSTNQFEATWSNVAVQFNPTTNGEWFTLQDAGSCNPMGSPGSCCEGRHEAAYVQSGDKFYLLGGREDGSRVNIYDPQTDTWTLGATPPMLLHHFQAHDYHGLILAACAFTGSFPNEPAVDSIMVYDPQADAWYSGPEIPVGRRRGSAGSVVHNDTLFLAGGNTMGHNDGSVQWFDKYDLRNNVWTALPNAPNRRDHFHAAIINDQLVAAAGRRTGEGGSTWLATEPTVDIFNMTTQSWDTIVNPIPTERAGNTVAVLNDELLVIGGEKLSGLANNETEALDIGSETWRTLDDLNTGRHGTQAIVNNDGVYVATGSLIRGGSELTNTRTTEAFYFFGPTEPVLAPYTQSSLSANDLDFGQVNVFDSMELDLRIDVTGGSQAILVQSLSLFDGTAFSMDTNLNFPRFIKPADSLILHLQFNPEVVGTLEDTLYIQHTGANAPQSKIVLTGEGLFTWIGGNRAYVDSAATGNTLGNSWPNAFKEVSRALEVADEYTQINEIWIARGTYTPGTLRTSTFTLVDSVALYGGFAGTESLLSERDINAHPVILDGDIGVLSDSLDNVYHVVSIPIDIDTALLDGVIIQNGTANGPVGNQQIGAGVLNQGSATLKDCTIRFCASVLNGSAVFTSGGSSVLRLDGITLEDNSDPYVVNFVGSTLIWVNSSDVR